MERKLADIIRSVVSPSDGGPRYSVDGDAMVVDCVPCGKTPDPADPGCMGCMVEGLMSQGAAERILLRTGRDLEVSGRSAKALSETASLRKWSMPSAKARNGLRCMKCPVSKEQVMNAAWAGFPFEGTGNARARIAGAVPQGGECERCMLSTARALDQLDSGLERTRAMLLREPGDENGGRPG